ncbi:MAG TPA: UDP-glucuronosyltransferase [Candidatus Copromorpha excrementigallinarum]|uniref:UDP-glucuronosyltransferase n=1 Tax=Candidatus Allocopromorpha excrementigallinarum TaxID=2840742 RepID=A0A9D1I1F6_9FIRM|nr:UDP-glucuronosyltransferase [Candidatus Copromorpha excrementigallinarum]
MEKRKRLIVAAAAYNWAEAHRMAEIGKEFLKRGWEVFSLGSGRYDYLLKDKMEHLNLEEDSGWYTDERIKKLMDMDKWGNDYCREEELEEMTAAEVRLMEKIRPDLVITGYRTTLSLSCRIYGVPLVWVLSAVVSPLYYKYGLATMPERVPVRFVETIEDRELQRAYYCRLALKNKETSRVWNKVARNHGVRQFECDTELFTGDFNLMSDAPELFPEFRGLPREYRFCGPLLNHEEIPQPAWKKTYKETGRKKILVTMGSSGERDILLKVLEGLKKADADIFVSTASVKGMLESLEKDRGGFPESFYFAERLPHLDMAGWVDLSIIHGGQGTVYTTALGGKPFIGIPMFSEQQYNLENIMRAGSGEKISAAKLSSEELLERIDRIFSDGRYYEKAEELRRLLEPYADGREESPEEKAFMEINRFFFND